MNRLYFVPTLVCFGTLLAAAQVTLADELSEVYSWIPHKQTTYQSERSELPGEEARQLSAVFALTDRALVTRVRALQWLASNGKQGWSREKVSAESDQVLAELLKQKLPTGVGSARDLIVQAVRDQQNFLLGQFDLQARNAQYRVSAAALESSEVESSHGRLISAYNALMAAYPNESAHNRQAFYDHLCALDFK